MITRCEKCKIVLTKEPIEQRHISGYVCDDEKMCDRRRIKNEEASYAQAFATAEEEAGG